MVSPLNLRIRLNIALILTISAGWLFIGRRDPLLATVDSAESKKYVRVAIMQNTKSFNLKVPGRYEVCDPVSGRVFVKDKVLKTTVVAHKQTISLGGMFFSAGRIFIRSLDKGPIIINSRRFRGDIELIKKDDSCLVVINYIDLEDYIKGILYHEVSHYWPVEALKAQAIVSRTYALNQVRENKDKDFDLTADIYSQVYGGRTSERYRTNLAVEGTKGQVLIFNGDIFPAYFHATCGGHTERASLVWDIDIAPLRGVVCSYCKASPHFNWHNVLSAREIIDALAKSGYQIDAIDDILIEGRDDSGRVTKLKLVSDEKNINISAKDFRNTIGPNIIRSTNFEVDVVENDAVFEGIGWGHGVGLCQWGAYFMAKDGATYQEILEYYYPQTHVKTLGF